MQNDENLPPQNQLPRVSNEAANAYLSALCAPSQDDPAKRVAAATRRVVLSYQMASHGTITEDEFAEQQVYLHETLARMCTRPPTWFVAELRRGVGSKLDEIEQKVQGIAAKLDEFAVKLEELEQKVDLAAIMDKNYKILAGEKICPVPNKHGEVPARFFPSTPADILKLSGQELTEMLTFYDSGDVPNAISQRVRKLFDILGLNKTGIIG